MTQRSADEAESSPGKNRLAGATSPYLLQHAQNPVDWYPWGPEALARAVAEDKPILLSVGYSACHWCHVMAHESFENPAIAARMNADFINIKVDREERPDIDAIYQKVVALMGEGGGWPLTVFLTPQQRPFFGGTYFPPDERYGRPGFPRLLEALSTLWQERRIEAERQADAFMEGFADLGRSLDEDLRTAASDLDLVRPEATHAGVQGLLTRFDEDWGGFGRAPKFPNVPGLELLLSVAKRERASGEPRGPAAKALLTTLEKMWRGGIYDHLRGGFARYSTDQKWLIPHFEKMLYDNGLLLGLYAEASVALADAPAYLRRVVEETADYLRDEMRTPAGAFFSATDADSEGVEGKYFCWTPAQLGEVLGEALAQRVASAYGVTADGNFEDGLSVLHLPVPLPAELDAELAPARAKLLAARSQRVAPQRDDKVLTAWNALVISGLCRAAMAAEVWGAAARVREWTELAEAAARALWTEHRDEGGRLLRASWQGRGHTRAYLEDVALLARALLDLHELTLDPHWHDAAAQLAGELCRHYARDGGGVYQTADDGEALIVRSESQHDSPLPAGVAVAVEILARLELGGPAGHAGAPAGAREQIEATLTRFRSAARQPFAHAGILRAATWAGAAATHVTLRAATPDAAQALATAARRQRLLGPEPIALSFVAEAERAEVDALVCRAQACSMPLTGVDALLARLTEG